MHIYDPSKVDPEIQKIFTVKHKNYSYYYLSMKINDASKKINDDTNNDTYIFIFKKVIDCIIKMNIYDIRDNNNDDAMKISQNVLNVLNKTIKYYRPTRQEIILLCKIKYLHNLIYECLQNYNYIFNTIDIPKIILPVIEYNKSSEIKNNLIDIFFKHYSFDNMIFRNEDFDNEFFKNDKIYEKSDIDIIKNLEYNHFTIDDSYYNNSFAQHIDKTNAEFNDSMLETICCSLPYALPAVHALIGKGCKINMKCLRNVCKFGGDTKSIHVILKLGENIVIDNTCLYNLFNSVHYVGKHLSHIAAPYFRHGYYLKGRIINDEDFYNSEYGGGFTIDALRVLLDHTPKYQITKEDIIEACKLKIEIPKKYIKNIEFDEDILKACKQVRFYPKYNFNCVTNEQMEFYRLCLTRQCDNIKKYYRNHRYGKKTIVIDEHCMEIPGYLKTLQTLVKLGGQVPYYAMWHKRGKFSYGTHSYLKSEFEKQCDANKEKMKKLEQDNEILKEKILDLENDKKQLYYKMCIDWSNPYPTIPSGKRKKTEISKVFYSDMFNLENTSYRRKMSFVEIKQMILTAIKNKEMKKIQYDIVKLPFELPDSRYRGKYLHIDDIDYLVAFIYSY